MSNDVFIAILNMDITASYVAFAIIAIRVFLKKAPKLFLYVLWLPVFIRLVLPFSFSSGVSFLNMLKPGTQTSWGVMEYIPGNIASMQKPVVDVGISGINSSVNASLPAATPFASASPMEILLAFYEIIWITGIVLLLLYCIFSCWKVMEKAKTATVLKDRIFESDRITTPFVFGFIKPKILIPLGLSEDELTYILAHERTHIKRMDHIIKPLAFLIVG
ncbi:MAG TPA: M56 family metallopeptidase [Clostridia bacterium]